MPTNFLHRLIRQGTEGPISQLEYRKVLLINNLVLFCASVLLILIGINIYQGIYSHVFIDLGVLLLLFPVIWLNSKKHFQSASIYLINYNAGAIVLASYLAYQQGRFTETENILFAFLGVSIFIFDGWWKNAQAVLLVSILIVLKYVKFVAQELPIDGVFFLSIVNILVVCAGLYYFLNIFKKALNRALATSNEHEGVLFSLIDNVPIFMALVDKDEKYKIVNENYVKAFGKPREEIVDAYCKDILPPNIWDVHGPLVKRALKGESPEFLEKTEMPDGSILYAAGRYVPIVGENGNIQSVTVFVDDVTNLKNVEDQLKLELKEKDKLFSIIAHDIRSPLNLFEGLLNASDNQIITQEEFLVFKDKLRERFISLQETINGLLEWSRLQLDRIQPAPVEFKPDRVVDELINVFKPIAENKEIRISQSGKAEMVTMDINHYRIIFRNLLHNALKFTPNGGEIAVNYECTDEFVQVSVSDTGVGMSNESIEKVMTKEDVASATGTMGETGTGLGLHLSLELLEKNGGQMAIHRNEDAGTTFRVRIPC